MVTLVPKPFTVAQRRREIGIRAALGASSLSLLGSIFSRVTVQVAIGMVLGAIGAAAIAPGGAGAALAGRLAIVTPAMALTMMVVGVLAAYRPARRSLRIQPTEALRGKVVHRSPKGEGGPRQLKEPSRTARQLRFE